MVFIRLVVLGQGRVGIHSTRLSTEHPSAHQQYTVGKLSFEDAIGVEAVLESSYALLFGA